MNVDILGGKGIKVQVYGLISSLETYHFTPWSLDLFVRVPFLVIEQDKG